jgi:hypothetical protein
MLGNDRVVSLTYARVRELLLKEKRKTKKWAGTSQK